MTHENRPESFFDGPSAASREEVWKWWERRRFRYNRDIFLVGVATCVLIITAGSEAVEPGEDFVEPVMLLLGPVLYGIFANIGFTLGPVYDIVFYRGGPRKNLFKAGYLFSLLLTAVPGAWAVVACLTALITGAKL